MTAIKPLQAICSFPACRRRQVVPGDRVWYVDVRKGPGSHREAGWACRFCGNENTTPPSHLPRDMIPMLPSRQQVLNRIEASVQEKRRAEQQPDGLVVERKSSVSPAQTTKKSIAKRMPMPPETALRSADPVSVPKRIVEQDISADGPKTRGGDRSNSHEMDEMLQPGRSAPTWVDGRLARMALTEALARVARHGGEGMAICNGHDGFEALKVRLPDDRKTSDIELANFANMLLKELDERRADILVLSGSLNRRPWQAILHVSAGAVSFV